MKKLMILIVLVLSVACGNDGEGAGGRDDAPNPLAERGGEWQLISGSGPKGVIEPVEGYPITLFVEEDEISGIAGCNHYGGSARISGNDFEVPGGLAMTEIGCSPSVHDAESAYLEALGVVDQMRLADEELVLHGSDAELRFEWEPPPQTADLIGTRWKLGGLTIGEGPDGTVSSARRAWLRLDEDKRLRGSTGCRTLEGSWEERGSQVQVTSLSLEGECPKNLRDQDSHIVAVIGDGFTFEIETRELRVHAPRGNYGLIYRAP